MPDKQTFVIRDKAIRERAMRAVSVIQHEPLTVVTIKPYKKSKIQEQLGYLFGVVLKKIQEHIRDANGDNYTTDDLYEWFIDEYGESRVVTVNGKHKVVKLTASKMNTAEMSDFITRIIQMAAEDLGCVIPWPEVGMRED